jgi:hypothetical protein
MIIEGFGHRFEADQDSLTDEQIQDIKDFAEKIRADIQLVDGDVSSQ